MTFLKPTALRAPLIVPSLGDVASFPDALLQEISTDPLLRSCPLGIVNQETASLKSYLFRFICISHLNPSLVGVTSA